MIIRLMKIPLVNPLETWTFIQGAKVTDPISGENPAGGLGGGGSMRIKTFRREHVNIFTLGRGGGAKVPNYTIQVSYNPTRKFTD